jgi:hypothetical protein
MTAHPLPRRLRKRPCPSCVCQGLSVLEALCLSAEKALCRLCPSMPTKAGPPWPHVNRAKLLKFADRGIVWWQDCFLCCLALMLLLTSPAAMAGVDTGPAGESVTVGFAGVSKTAVWTPVRVRLPADDTATRVRVWAADPEGQPVGSPWRPLAETAGGDHEATLHVRLGRPEGDLAIEFERAGQGVSGRQAVDFFPPLPQSSSLLLVIGDVPAAARAVRLLEDDEGWRPTVVSVGVADLPGASPLDFDAADAVVVAGSACPLPENVFTALDDWVHGGGRLVFLAGESLERLAAEEAAELAWLPASFERLVPLRSTAVIETFARASRPLQLGSAQLSMPMLAEVESGSAATLAAVGPTMADLPLAVRRPRGFGTIGWLAFDLDREAFAGWPGSDSLLLSVLGSERKEGGRSGETRRDLLDIGGQLRRSVDQFPGVKAVPFELIGLLAILFVASLYPLSWWLAAPPSGRGGWLALAVSVVGFTLLASVIGGQWKSSRWQTVSTGIVDIDVSSGMTRGFSMQGIWSPENASITVSAEASDAVMLSGEERTVISWAAATGRSFGGPDTLVPHASLAAAAYGYGENLAALERVPLAIATSGIWQASWEGMVPAGFPVLSGRFEQTAEGTLRGELINRLPFALEDCLLAYAGWLYDVGSFPAGGRFNPSSGRGPRSLSGAISRRMMVGEREQGGRYELDERNQDRILEVASFHEAAGGRSYTSLEAGVLCRYDLSDLIRSGRAVLLGRGPVGTDWKVNRDIDSEEDSYAVWRFVLPVGAGFGTGSPGDQTPAGTGVSP